MSMDEWKWESGLHEEQLIKTIPQQSNDTWSKQTNKQTKKPIPNVFPIEDTLPEQLLCMLCWPKLLCYQNPGQTEFVYQFTRSEMSRELEIINPLKLADLDEPEELIL